MPAPGAPPLDLLDAPSAVEFLREALIKIDEEEIGEIAGAMERKRELMRPRLAAAALGSEGGEVEWLLAHIFATRRRAGDILEAVGGEELSSAISELLHGEGAIAGRFTAFDLRLEPVAPPVRRELAGECLRFFDPDRYWLWARWMWDPRIETGALPLILSDGSELHGEDAGETYEKVGAAVKAIVVAAGELGFDRMRRDRFAVDVYLGAVYGVYLYTVTRMRMTQEFNQVIPKLPDLLRRLLGVHRLEV